MAVGLLTCSDPGTIVLTLDTATPAVSAGIVRCLGSTGRVDVLAERVTVDARAHAERITPNVLEALADAGLTMPDLDVVVVGCGPGPFTGLRVGMATAAAYGHALGIPVHGVCSLDAIGIRTAGDTLVVTDARRREVYWARYRDGVRVDGPSVNAPADVDAGAAQAVAGSPEHAALFDLPRCGPVYPTAAGLVRAVTMRAGTARGGAAPSARAVTMRAGTAGGGAAPSARAVTMRVGTAGGGAAPSASAVADWSVNPLPLVPLYLRRPDAKTVAERKQPAGDDAGREGSRRSGGIETRSDDAGREGSRRSGGIETRGDDAGREGSRRSGGIETVTVNSLIAADAARCAQLEALLFPGDDPWPTAAFVREVTAKHNHYVAARTADTLVGYAGISRLGRKPPFEYEVHTIGVDPAYQGQGIGRRLLAELLEFAAGGVVHLEVRTDNAPAIALYRSLGFVNVGLRRRYYRVSGADAYTMRREAR